MKDFVRDGWKIATACAVGAFVLSLLVGLIAANPFGIALSRAFLLALLFAALGFGLRAVVRAYLPEVMGARRPDAGAEAPASAGTVDIVLPEDEGLQREAFQGGEGRGAAGSADEEEEPTEVLDADEPTQAEARALGELAGDLGEEFPQGETGEEGAGGAGENGPPFDAGPVGGEEAEEVQPEDELPRSVAGMDAGELDALPDLTELEPPSGQKSGPAARVPRSAVGQTPEDAVRNLLSNEDPATLARAVRTALKKDEKG